MSDYRDNLSERALKFIFFLTLLAYALLMLSDIPSGNSGLFPRVVIPIVVVLLVYRLFTILTSFSLHSGTDSGLFEFDPSEAQELDESDDATGQIGSTLGAELPEPRRFAIIAGWIALGFVLVYLFGILVGGFVYIFSFLFFLSEFGLRTSGGTAVLFTIMLYILIFAFEFQVWNGLINI